MRKLLRKPIASEDVVHPASGIQSSFPSELRLDLLEALIEHMPAGVIIAEAPSGKLILANQEVEKILGAPLQLSRSTVYHHAYKGFHADGRPYQPDEWPLVRALRWGREVTGEEIRLQREDGGELHLCVNAAPVRDASGRVVAGVATFTDITERKRAEATLQNTQKMATSGRLVASVAHELKSPLGTLTNLMYLLESNRDLAETSRQHVRLAEDELKRAQQIIAHTVGLFRESSKPVAVNLAEVLNSIVEFYAPKAHAREITVERRFQCPGLIQGFPAEMRQVLTNLLVNALEAVSPHGRVVVRLGESRDWRTMELTGVRVTVCDNGCGIRPEHLRRIFDPSFTTKGERGTGLGLWITRDIVYRRGGTIHVRSKAQPPANGTIFSIFLPKTMGEWKAPARA